MRPEYESNWEFFFVNIDDHIGSIRVDLALNKVAPIMNYDKVICIQLKMNNPYEDGLSSSDESEKLWNIEDSLTTTLEEHLNAVFSGTETTNGQRRFYFYSPSALLAEKFVSDAMVQFPDYDYDVAEWEEAEWSTYFTFLFPSDENLQKIGNRNVIENLEDRGDDLNTPREVYHWIYFEKQNDREQFIKAIEPEGFKIDELEKESEDFTFGLNIFRIENIEQDNIDEVVLKLFSFAKKYNGNYDGWETEIIINKAE